jgi:chromosome partitioning protein
MRARRTEVAAGARVIAVMNQKGGVGKTTTAVNLAASLAVLEHSVLLVDLDPQGAVSACLGLGRDEVQGGILDVVVSRRSLESCILKVGRVPLSVVPANMWTDDDEAAFGAAIRPTVLVSALAAAREAYDYVLLDSPPSMGPVAVAVMAAADAVLVPVQCEELAVLAVGKTVRLMRKVRAALNPRLALAGLVITMADGRTSLTVELANALRDSFGDAVLRTLIPRSVDLVRSVARGEPLLYYSAQAPAAQAYLRLAMEVVRRSTQESAA